MFVTFYNSEFVVTFEMCMVDKSFPSSLPVWSFYGNNRLLEETETG